MTVKRTSQPLPLPLPLPLAPLTRLARPLSLLLVAVTLTTTACATLRNRRDLYFAQTIRGPYTRLLNHLTGKPKSGSLKSSAPQTPDGKGILPPQKG